MSNIPHHLYMNYLGIYFRKTIWVSEKENLNKKKTIPYMNLFIN